MRRAVPRGQSGDEGGAHAQLQSRAFHRRLAARDELEIGQRKASQVLARLEACRAENASFAPPGSTPTTQARARGKQVHVTPTLRHEHRGGSRMRAQLARLRNQLRREATGQRCIGAPGDTGDERARREAAVRLQQRCRDPRGPGAEREQGARFAAVDEVRRTYRTAERYPDQKTGLDCHRGERAERRASTPRAELLPRAATEPGGSHPRPSATASTARPLSRSRASSARQRIQCKTSQGEPALSRGSAWP
jgi:hypothetical protein